MTLTSKINKRQSMIILFQNKYNTKTETYNNYLFLIGNMVQNINPTLTIFGKRGHKPLINYRFTNEESRTKFIIDYKNKIDLITQKDTELENQYLKEKEAFVEGTILYSSWGYEQTNIDFYLILSRKNDFVILQKIGLSKTYDEQDSGQCTPNVDVKIDEPIRKKISKYARINIDSFRSCSLYKGKPLYWSSYY